MAQSHIRIASVKRAPPRVVVAHEDRASRQALVRTLEADGWEVIEAPTGASLVSCMVTFLMAGGGCPADLLVLEAAMPGLAGIELLASLRRMGRCIPAIVVGCRGGEEIEAWRLGDAQALGPDWDPLVVRTLASRVLRDRAVQEPRLRAIG